MNGFLHQGGTWLAEITPPDRLRGWLLLALVIWLLLIMLVISFTLLRRWRIQNQPDRLPRNGAAAPPVDAWSESARRLRVEPEAAAEPPESPESGETREPWEPNQDDEEKDDEDRPWK